MILILLLWSNAIFNNLKDVLGYDAYVGGYGFHQWTFAIFLFALTFYSTNAIINARRKNAIQI